MDDMAPVIALIELDLAAERGGRTRLRGEFQILGGDGKGDGRVGVEVEKAGGGSHDLEVSEPFVAGVVGSGAFGDKDGSGESVDQEVALWLPVGVHGNEGVDGIHGRDVESVVHGNEGKIVQWLPCTLNTQAINVNTPEMLRESVPDRNVVREASGAIPAFDCVVRSGSVRIRQ